MKNIKKTRKTAKIKELKQKIRRKITEKRNEN